MKWDPRLSVCTQTAMKEGADELFKAGQITTNVPLAAMMDTSIIGLDDLFQGVPPEMRRGHP